MGYFKTAPALDLSIVIVSFNVKDFLKACLNSLYHSIVDIEFEVFVVDNNSQDATAQMIERDFPQVKLIQNHENIGFVKANNRAFERSQGRYILMLNPDTVILENYLHVTVRYFDQEPNVGAIGCKMLNPDHSLQASCYNFPSLREIFGMYFVGSQKFSGLKKMDYNKTQEVDFVRGAFLALNRRCLEEIGLLDERLFMFGEETDLCYRMKLRGWKVLYMPDTVIIHHKGKSTEQITDNMYSQRIQSLIYYFQKHRSKLSTFMLRVIIFLGVGSRLLLRALINIRNKYSGEKTISKDTQFEALRLALGLNK